MRTLTVVALAMLMAPWTAMAGTPVTEDVAWLADLVGVAPGDLPATFPATETTFASGVLTTRDIAIPLADYAAQIRESQGVGADAEKQFAGAGARSADAGTRGVRWSASLIGSASSTPCIAITAQHNLGDPAGLGRGAAMINVHGETPGGRGSGVATMDVQVLPNPGPGTPVATTLADGQLAAGSIVLSCRTIFSLRITTGTFLGDGVIYADGQ